MGETPETSNEAPEAKRRLKMVVGGAVAFVLAAVIAIALLFSSSKTGPECNDWLNAKAAYLKDVPPIQQETASDSVNFDGKVVVGGKTYIRPSTCK
jgi:hypothetical protein